MADDRPTPRWRHLLAGGAAFALLVGAGCSGSDDPDPGAPGAETELDGGEADTGGTDGTSTTADESGGTTGGATEGNQTSPGDTTDMTAQDAEPG